MTCKDCLHFAICANVYCEVTAETEIKNIHGKPCFYFKDKSKYIELPCKVGNTVYHYCKEVCAILPYFIERIVIDYDVDNSNGYWTFEGMCSKDDELIDAFDFTTNEIGKIVFLTKFEAEQKLKELNRKCLN